MVEVRMIGRKLLEAGAIVSETFSVLVGLVLTVELPYVAVATMLGSEGLPESYGLVPILALGLARYLAVPVYVGAMLFVMARHRLSRGPTTYRSAVRFGLAHWWRLLSARLVAGLLVAAGLVVPTG